MLHEGEKIDGAFGSTIKQKRAHILPAICLSAPNATLLSEHVIKPVSSRSLSSRSSEVEDKELGANYDGDAANRALPPPRGSRTVITIGEGRKSAASFGGIPGVPRDGGDRGSYASSKQTHGARLQDKVGHRFFTN